MLVFRYLQNLNTFIVLGVMMLCIVLMIQVKEIYNNNQKYNRYLVYKQSMAEMSMDLNTAEQTANKSEKFVQRITKALIKHDKEIKNTSTSSSSSPPRVTFPV